MDMLEKGPKISDPTKRLDTHFSLSHVNRNFAKKFCQAHFSSFSGYLTR